MKILIAGADKIFSIEVFYRKYLADLGAEVQIFTTQNLFYDYYRASFANKVIFRLGLSGIYRRISHALQQQLMQYRPDLLWVFKGMEIEPWLYDWARNEGITLVNFNGDNPFIFSGRGSGNSNVTNSISFFDLHLTYNRSVLDRFQQMSLHARYLPFGFELEPHVYDLCASEAEIGRVAFVGNPDAKRASFISDLANAGLKIDVFGHGWEKFLNHERITLRHPVYGQEQWKCLRKYRVQLNLLRDHNLDSHNMRTFEIPAVGGIMLGPRTAEHISFFQDGREAHFFGDVHHCAKIARALLDMNPPEARAIRDAARMRSLVSGYSYKDRARQAFEYFQTL